MKEMVGGCCVCSDEHGWAENPLVYCDGHGCNVAVHQACYGIVQVPTGSWFCRKCESQERAARVKCELCPHREGALKRTDTSVVVTKTPGKASKDKKDASNTEITWIKASSWAHVICALYIPEVQFGNVATMEPIILTMVPNDRFNKICYICEESGRESKASSGACMTCNKNGCRQSFHVTCAQMGGLLCEEQGNYQNVKYCGYCSHHYSKLVKNELGFLQGPVDPQQPKKDSNIKPIPAFRYQLSDSYTSPDRPTPAPSKPQQRHKKADREKTVKPKKLKVAETATTSAPDTPPSSSPAGMNSMFSSSLRSLEETTQKFTSANFIESPGPPQLTPIQPNYEGPPVVLKKKPGRKPNSAKNANQNHNQDKNSESSITSASEFHGFTPMDTSQDSDKQSRTSDDNNSKPPTPQPRPPSLTSNHSSASGPSEPANQRVATPVSVAATTVSVTTTSAISTTLSKSAVSPHQAYESSFQDFIKSKYGTAASNLGSPSSTTTAVATATTTTTTAASLTPEISATITSQAVKRPRAAKSGDKPEKKKHRISKKKHDGPGRPPKTKTVKELVTMQQQAVENAQRALQSPTGIQSGYSNRDNVTTMYASALGQQNGPLSQVSPTQSTSSNTSPRIPSVPGPREVEVQTDGQIRFSYIPLDGGLLSQMQARDTRPAHPYQLNMNHATFSSELLRRRDLDGASVLDPPTLSTPGVTALNGPRHPSGGSSRGPLSPRFSDGPNHSMQPFPTSIEQLLERQWNEGSQFLMEQAAHFDIATLLSCLQQLRQENQRLEEHVHTLLARRDHLLAVTARLSVPLNAQATPQTSPGNNPLQEIALQQQNGNPHRNATGNSPASLPSTPLQNQLSGGGVGEPHPSPVQGRSPGSNPGPSPHRNVHPELGLSMQDLNQLSAGRKSKSPAGSSQRSNTPQQSRVASTNRSTPNHQLNLTSKNISSPNMVGHEPSMLNHVADNSPESNPNHKKSSTNLGQLTGQESHPHPSVISEIAKGHGHVNQAKGQGSQDNPGHHPGMKGPGHLGEMMPGAGVPVMMAGREMGTLQMLSEQQRQALFYQQQQMSQLLQQQQQLSPELVYQLMHRQMVAGMLQQGMGPGDGHGPAGMPQLDGHGPQDSTAKKSEKSKSGSQKNKK
ncbi:PREDICTED: protein AF-10-like isoform X3 [Branchiostoma belcheri]|uniref:Protein AF-10-like isoform X3 n=1 Tax=Branchiostoma belcheri TaxID=7741 RepID=A0A6P4YLQ9_BRABE|nr:PREDICTED: protein AF-10-like isoform X3 [Branchiostoma belcheri]